KIITSERTPITSKILEMYRENPDSGIHSAAEWALRKWSELNALSQVDAGERDWYVNSQGQTMLIVRERAESRRDEPAGQKQPEGTPLSSAFAIAACEVTVEQFQKFRRDQLPLSEIALQRDCPMNTVSLFDAAAYCNWLSANEGIDENQWCYEPNENGEYA